MLVNMKGSILGFGSIAIILILGAYVIVHVTSQGPYEDYVATREGELASFGNFNNFFLKTFNQSVEFISQRVAYEMAKNGGFYLGEEVYWNIYYPRIPDLQGKLERAIERGLPSYYKKLKRTVTLKDAAISVNEQNQYFDVTGSANFSITDDSIRAQTFSHQNINSHVYSSYFRLLRAAREILENETFNSSLNNYITLLGLLRQETLNPSQRFYGLDFEMAPSGDVLDVNITDICSPDVYCLAPLYSDEPKVLKSGSEWIPYDYVKLSFKIKTKQTGTTPTTCDYMLDIDPKIDSMLGNDIKDPGPTITITDTGTTNDNVVLSAEIYDSTGNLVGPAVGITVSFADNGKPMPYTTSMIIQTVNTPTDVYTINVTADGCSLQRLVTYNLTVNPSMTFSIKVVPNVITIIKKAGEFSLTNVIVNITGGIAQPVNLYMDSLPQGIQPPSFSTNNIPPNFSSVLNITTDGTTPAPRMYNLRVKGTSGGSYSEGSLLLIVQLPFSFSLTAIPNSATIFKTQSVLPSPQIRVSGSGVQPQAVNLTFSILNSSNIPSPDNYNVSVSFANNPCTPGGPGYECYVTMQVSTNSFTPPDTYQITIYGNTSAGMPLPLPFTTFSLTVKNTECLDIGFIPSPQCIAKYGSTATPCEYRQCVNYVCQKNNYPKDWDPSGQCNTFPCNGICEPFSGGGTEYRNPPSLTYNKVCDGLGSCNNTFDIAKCRYAIVKACRLFCDPAEAPLYMNCYAGAGYCEPMTACCQNPFGSCGNGKAVYRGRCEFVLIYIARFLSTVTCGWGAWWSDAVIIHDQDGVTCDPGCDGTANNIEPNCGGDAFNCESSPYSGGCSQTHCYVTDACKYPVTCGDEICEGENGENSVICPDDCPVCTSFHTKKDCLTHNCFWNSGVNACFTI